jgi:hypothetical protein
LGLFNSQPLALVCILETTRDGDDTVGAWHLELEIGITEDCLEFGIVGSPKDGMVRTLKVYDFKGECLLAVVYLVTKCDKQSDRAEGHNPSFEDDPMERRMRGKQFACLDV